jgi:outer membrane immunogenic protein
VGASAVGVSLEGDMTFRAFVGGLVLAVGTAVSLCGAEAADLPAAPRPAQVTPVAPIPYAPQVYNWSGIYFGGHIGGGYSSSSWSDPFTGTSNDTFNNWGFLGGAQVGANAQFNRLVLGVEGDFSWTSLKGSGTDSIGEGINTNVQWTSTVTGRIGAAFDRLLVYSKGGLALAQDQSSLTDLGGNTASTSFLRTGWTAGAGIEYALDDNWSAKIEYDYLGFGSKTLSFTTPLESVTSNTNLNVQEIKAGINFRFGGGQ